VTERYIHHVTLSTGDVRRSPRSEVSDAAIGTAARMLADARYGAHVSISEYADVEPAGCTLWLADTTRCPTLVVYGPGDGAALVMIGIATRSRCGAPLWRRLHAAAYTLATDPDRCPAEPWCAARLEIGLALYPEAAHWLGDLERCLAWAWIAR